MSNNTDTPISAEITSSRFGKLLVAKNPDGIFAMPLADVVERIEELGLGQRRMPADSEMMKSVAAFLRTLIPAEEDYIRMTPAELEGVDDDTRFGLT
ncbi:MAG: hypothetical protein J0M07_07020 [Anaerolineae bacterium]|nr:hypothetical protein [Anaerolineae bacterium]